MFIDSWVTNILQLLDQLYNQLMFIGPRIIVITEE